MYLYTLILYFMKKGLYLLFILCLTGFYSCNNESTPPPVEFVEVNDAVPNFSVISSAGAEVNYILSDFLNRKTLIVFFRTDCRDCQRELPKIQAMWNDLKNEGLQLIMISRGQDAETVREYWAAAGFNMPWFIDPDRSAFSKFATSTVPRLYLADNGFVKWKAIENLDKMGIANGADLKAKIIEIVGLFKDPVEVGSTVPTFTVNNSGGAAVTFTPADFIGRKSLIVFFTTVCPDCQRELPKVQAAWEVLEAEGLQLITIGRDQLPTDVQAYWNSTANGKPVFDMPWYVDPGRNAFNKFAVKTIPRLYLVDETGKVVWIAVENLVLLGINNGNDLIAKINEFN